MQKVRSARPDLLLFLPNAISDAKLVLEKMNEFGLGQGKVPTISFGITIAEPDMLQSVSPETVQGVMTIVANWGSKGQEALIAELKAKYKEPWMTQNVISTYGDMWLMKEALEKAGKADRDAVARGAAHHGCRPVEILSGRPAQVRREGPPRRRRRRHRAMADRACLSPSIRPISRKQSRSGRRNPEAPRRFFREENCHDCKKQVHDLAANAIGRRVRHADRIPRLGAATSEVKVGLLVPISGLYARPGTVMREGAEMAVDHINAQGGIKALGGAKLKLVVLDSGDTTEKAKNAAQRMVAQETDLVAASGAYLSSFTLAVTEVTERASLPVLTLSYSDLITDRGFKYVFQTAATAGSQARQALPQIIKLAETASGKRPKTVAILTDNTGASIASAKAMREGLLAENQLQLIVDETFTPPLADATSLVQKIRSAKPDLLFFLPTVISDAKLLLEKMNEFGLGQGKMPTISFGIAIAEPDMLQTVSPELLQGVLTCVASWGAKGHEALIAELKTRYKEPWMTQNAISTYGDMWVIKDALEKAGKADRVAVGEALRTMDAGPSKYYPLGEIKFDEKGRRVGAGMTIVQWQSGVPVTVFPPELALAQPFWPEKLTEN